MKEITIQEVRSDKAKGVYYIGKCDGFDINHLVEYKLNNNQKTADVQRPSTKKHISEIEETVEKEKMLFLWNMLLSFYGDVKIHERPLYTSDGKIACVEKYILFPETDEEMAVWAECFQLNDGQHRARALSNLKKLLGSYEVTLTILDHPDEITVRKQFRALNGFGKKMSTELLFDMSAEIGDLSSNKILARKLLVDANGDKEHPLCGSVKFGDGEGLSSSTIVNKWVNNKFDLIKEMEDAHVTNPEEQYRIFKLAATAFKEVSEECCNETRKNNKKYKLKAIKPSRYGVITGLLMNALVRSKELENRNRTLSYAKELCRTLLDILLVDNFQDSDNREISYQIKNSEPVNIKEVWGGNSSSKDAFTKMVYVMFCARAGKMLKAEVVQ